jgi:hypothetical protein
VSVCGVCVRGWGLKCVGLKCVGWGLKCVRGGRVSSRPISGSDKLCDEQSFTLQ